jgi:methyltransferase-like protein
VADGQAVVRELGLANVNIRPLSILEVGEDFGEFDYILAHGVYSWVPPEVQDKILDICRHNLAPTGVAYVSYNTLPGWHARGAIREMLWYHTGHLQDPTERIREARALLDFLASSVGSGDGGYGGLLRQELSLLRHTPDTYVLHEHLDDFNEPLYFHQFIARAAGRDLQYLGEAQLQTMVAGRFGEEAEKKLRQISPDILHMEQYMDFLRNRMFRQTLLCHASVRLEHVLKSEAVRQFNISSSVKPVSASPDLTSRQPEEFRGDGPVTFSTKDPLMKAALLHLSESWPVPLPFDDLLAAARARLGGRAGEIAEDGADELPRRLLYCYTSNIVEFSQSQPRFVGQVSNRPVASPYARLRARTGGKVTNLRLETVALGEPSRLLLCHLDGTRDQASLTGMMSAWLEQTKPAANAGERSAQFVEQALRGFARSALLIG